MRQGPRARAACIALVVVISMTACKSSDLGAGGGSATDVAPEVSFDTTLVAASSSPVEDPTTAATEVAAPSVSDHHQVVAQGIVGFGPGEHHWEFTTTTVTSSVATIDTGDPTFVVSDVPDGVLVGPSSAAPSWRLRTGEAILQRDGGTLDALAVGPSGGSLMLIKAVPGAGPDTFTPGEGPRDVDLVRDVLGTNEALVLQSTVAAFLLVTSGAVDVAGSVIAAGSPVALSGDFTLTNPGSEPATVVVAVIGPAPGEPAPPPPTTTDPPQEAPQPTGASAATAPRPTAPAPAPTPTSPRPTTTAPTPTTTPATTTTSTTTTTTAPPSIDTDGDDLSDVEEAALGTDPTKRDTDLDGIPDGREVKSLRSNPLKTDSDNDLLTDALEVDKSCDVNKPDTDGDGLGDAFEANSGFSECSLADTDGDGDDDQAEFSIGTDPRDPDSHT